MVSFARKDRFATQSKGISLKEKGDKRKQRGARTRGFNQSQQDAN